MILSKKAIQSHLLILLVISGVMTVCILTVFRPFFTNDPQNCQPIDFEITKKCKTDEKVIFNIENNGDSIIRFKLNNEISDDYIITLEENKKEFSFVTVKDSIVILPYLINAHTKQEIGVCKGKKETIKTEALLKC